jgi:aminopeptidase N
MRIRLAILLVLTIAACAQPPEPRTVQPYDSGGPLIPEQAAYDVLHYDLALTVDPIRRSINGELRVRAQAVAVLEELVLDFDPRYQITQVRDLDGRDLQFDWRDTRIWIRLAEPAGPADVLEVTVGYQGQPRDAPVPPWDGGFTWAETALGEPWVGVSCETHGADIWWPCKDHPSDEPDNGVDLHFTVPKPLVCVSNGRLIEVTDDTEDRWTYHWRVSTPINNGDDVFHAALRRWAYPDPATEAATDGRQCRFSSTEQFQELVEQMSGQDLRWFFDVYLRQPELPRLVSEVGEGELHLRWEVPGGHEFPMPVEVVDDDRRLRVELPAGHASIPWQSDAEPIVDPDGWILRAES